MSFVLSKVFWLVLQPANLILLLLCAGIVLLWRHHLCAGRWLLTAGTIALLVVAVLPAAAWLTTPLEDRYPPPPLPQQVDGIILLGGASEPGLTERRGIPHLNGAAERLFAFIDLGRRYPDSTLAFSGGFSALRPGALREADVVREVLTMAGFDAGRVVFDAGARNTFENVRNLKALLEPAADETWMVVTSAWHMPRAMGVFSGAGWPVIPYPVDYQTGGGAGFGLGFDLADGLGALTRAAKEWVGLVAYYLFGYSDSVFPGPATPGR